MRSLALALTLVLGARAGLGAAVAAPNAASTGEPRAVIVDSGAVRICALQASPVLLVSTAIVCSTPLAAIAPLELQVPKNEGWVTDLTKTLTPNQKRELSDLMESYKQGTTHEIAVLIVPSLNGDSLESFALRVGREWGMGTKEKNNAALLLVAKSDRKMRIEVARGLEGSLTDSISGSIIRNTIAPYFKRGQFYEGIKAGVVAMHEAIGGKYGALPHADMPVSVGLVGCLVPFLFFMFVLIMIIARIRRWGGSPARRGRGLWGGMPPFIGPFFGGSSGGGGSGGGGFDGGGGFSGFGGGGGFSGGGASGGW